MAARIPQSFLDELLARTDLVELIQSRVPLKRAGREFKALCPFHDERTPSFTVSPRKQFYHCFGCGAHGDAIGFLMAYEHLGFLDAVEELAARAGLEVPREARGGDEREPLYEILAAATRFYRAQLEASAEARAYLERRGIDPATAARFQLGYAPEGWDRLVRALGRGEGERAALLAAGLALRGREGLYDRFRHRLMFPILDGRGRPVGFGGRVLGAGEPKYLNSPETPLFQKGRLLYALWQARREGGGRRLIAVEGYVDAITLHQHGFRETVATLGTAVTPEQVETLFRTAPDVVFCFDGDRAGRQAAWRAAEAALARMRDGRQALFLFLPEGEDPDSFVRREGAARFAALLAEAQPLSAFVLERLAAEADLATVEGRARYVERAETLLARVPESAFRELLTEEIARRGGRLARRPPPVAPVPRAGAAPGRSIRRTPLRTLIALLLQRPALAAAVAPERRALIAGHPGRGIGLLLELLELGEREPGLGTAAVLARFSGRREHPALLRLAALAWPEGEEAERREFEAALRQLLREALQYRLAELRLRCERPEGGEAAREAYREALRELAALRRQSP